MNKIFILSALIYFLQSFESLPSSSLAFFLKESLGFTPEKLMYIMGFGSLAWTIKPFFGTLIDRYFTKKGWISVSLIGSIIITLAFIFLPIACIPLLIVLFLLSGVNSSTRDIAIDGLSCIEAKKSNIAEKIQAWQWGSITFASIIVGIGGGYIAEKFNYKLGYLILIPFYIGILAINYFYKSPKENKDNISFINHLKSYKELITNKTFLLACIFLFLYKFQPSFGTVLWYRMRDDFHFTKLFIGTLDTINAMAALAGTFIFLKISNKISTYKLLYWSIFIGVISSLSYLYFTPASCIIYGIFYSIIGMIIHLTIMSWMSKSTLDGKESTSFALLCSISNIANSASTFSGAFLYPLIGLTPLIIISSFSIFLCFPILKKLNLK